jgi:LacI family transcriptional regulator
MVTLKDIANDVGVSVPTVSLILSGKGERYCPETRDAVTKAAARLGYQVDVAARALRQKKSFLLGTLFYGVNSSHMSDVLRGVSMALLGTEYAPVVFTHDTPEEEADHLQRCVLRKLDGYIANPAVDPEGRTAAEAYKPLLEGRTPIVEVFGRFLPTPVHVNADYAAAARSAVEYLQAQGHRRIALLTHSAYDVARATGVGLHFDAWEQWTGYSQAMREANLEPLLITHPLVETDPIEAQFFQGGFQSLAAVRHHKANPTAVCCYNDIVASGLLRACRNASMSIPRDLSVVGFGDALISSLVQPALTTFRMPSREIGLKAAQRLLALIRGESGGDVCLKPDLLIRESVRPLLEAER